MSDRATGEPQGSPFFLPARPADRLAATGVADQGGAARHRIVTALSATREPAFNIPGAVLATVVVLLGVQLARDWWLGEFGLVFDFAFIPARAGLLFGFDPVPALAAALSLDPGNVELMQRLGLARELVEAGDSAPWTFVSYALLHGSWTHLVLNCIWLVAFGAAVARRFGPVRFLVFLVAAAIGGAAVHLATHLQDVVPMVGASAAVSGCMAAAIRFVFQPGAPLGFGRLGDDDSYRLPALPLGEALRDRRVVTFLVVWFALNLVTGLTGSAFGLTDATIAWEAHVGGFLVGLLGFRLFDPARP